jgi:hypothetical protein
MNELDEYHVHHAVRAELLRRRLTWMLMLDRLLRSNRRQDDLRELATSPLVYEETEDLQCVVLGP